MLKFLDIVIDKLGLQINKADYTYRCEYFWSVFFHVVIVSIGLGITIAPLVLIFVILIDCHYYLFTDAHLISLFQLAKAEAIVFLVFCYTFFGVGAVILTDTHKKIGERLGRVSKAFLERYCKKIEE